MVTQKMETQKIKIAIVVLNWNGIKWLKKFLPILIKYSKEANIYMIDNNSTDKSVEFVKNNMQSVNIIKHTENKGYAQGYNDALKKINSTYYILINSDIEVTNNWLSSIIELMDKNPNIGASQPKILDINNRKMFEYAGASGGFIDILGYPFCRGRIFDTIEEDNGQYDDIIDIFWATGACLIIRATSFHEIGGFDEGFFAHQEEIDLCWRLQNRGYKIIVQPQSIVYHVGGGTLNTASPKKTFLNFRNNLSMLFKNLPFFKLIWIIPLRLILDGIAAITFLKKNNGISHLLSVGKAHLSFYTRIPSLIVKRLESNKKINLSGQVKFSILSRYYLEKVKRFQDL